MGNNLVVDALHDYNVRAFDNLNPPILQTPEIVGAPGTASYSYVATFTTIGGETTASDEVATTTAAAVLNGTNKVKIQPQTIPTGAKKIRFFKKVGLVWNFIGEVTVAVGYIYDTGQTPDPAIHPPSENTSGRPYWYALLVQPGRYAQRMEMSDLTAMIHRAIQDIADTIHKDGDVIEGGSPVHVSGTTWSFTAAKIYAEGCYLRVPAGQVTLVGTGTERVGVTIAPGVITYEDDSIIRNIDEGVFNTEAYNAPGADRLTFDVVWVVDNPNMIPIQDFVDGQPKTKQFLPERSMQDIAAARRLYDLAGSYVTRNFPMEVVAHTTDATKLLLKVNPGKAYPMGFEVETLATQSIPFNRARDVMFQNNGGTDGFSIPGGYVITTNPENYDVDGLKVSLTIGSGNVHVVTLSGSGQTAAQVGAQIEASVNAYPTDGDLVECTAAGGILKIQAIDGKNLTVNSVSDDAYTILGISTGTHTPVGTRIYPINDAYVKDVSDLSYRTETVVTLTHNGSTHIDDLGVENALDILGASTLAADCHDEKWDYLDGVDFVRVGNTISFAGMGGDEPNAGATYRVECAYNRNATKGARILVRVTDAQVVKGTVGGTDNLVFTGATVTKVIDGSSVTGLSGSISDAVGILRVNDSPGQAQSEYSRYAFLKNSTALAHATSQIDWSGAGAPGTGVTGQPQNSATYYVTLEAWYHATEGDYVGPDSFDMYEDIEIFGTDNLRDCIDFRTTGIWPVPDESPTFDYNYYLSRVDKLVLTDTGDFRLVTGSPAKLPPVPPNQTNVLSLAIVRLAPYTYGPGDTQVVSLEPIRITQQGLRNFGDRIARLEYWNVVNTLEKEVEGHPLAAEAKGLFTDALTGFNRIDTAFDKNGVKHTAAVDRLSGTLLLPATRQPKLLSVDLVNSTHVRRNGNILCLDYQPEVFDQQLQASIWVSCAPDYVYENFIGNMDITPSSLAFLDEEQLPAINVDYDNNLTGAASDGADLNSIAWGSWTALEEARQTGQDSNSLIWEQGQQRTGVQLTQIPGSITLDLGSRIADLSMVSMLQTTNPDGSPLEIQVRITGLVPNQDHAVSINGKIVNFSHDDSVQDPKGAQGTHTCGGFTTVETDNSGRLTGIFTMPEGIPTGSVPVKVFHYDQPDYSWAQATFFGAGFAITKQSTVIGIPNPSYRVETVTQTQIELWHQWDPVAQTFMLGSEITYISAVGLFFHRKSSTLPITLQIREVVNGYPTSSVLASCTLEPDDVQVSDDASLETLFTFDNVMGFAPYTEFCFVVVPGASTTDYEVWVAELGDIDVQSGNVIGPPMADGVFFHSPNGRTWEPWTKRDVKYKLYKSNFENDAQVVFDSITGIDASRIALAIEEFVAPGTHVVWSYTLDTVDPTWIPFDPFTDVVLEQIINEVQLRVDVTSLGGSYQIVEQIAGILFLLHQESADYISTNQTFEDPLNYPNKVVATMLLDADGTNGAGVTSGAPMYSDDDGDHWVQIMPSSGFVPVGQHENFYTQEFQTPDEAGITGASNTTPIVVESVDHEYQEDQIVVIADVTGNTAANGTWRAVSVTDDTLTLVDPDTGADSVGNGAYSGGGTINLAPLTQVRYRIRLSTTNQARTPKIQKIGVICSEV